jgi:diguanylate cyclase (GGDEF)-like protein/PAS domain S-box-containing protein
LTGGAHQFRKVVTDQMSMNPDAAESALAAVMALHPDAHISAIGPSGMFIPLPDSIELGDHRPITGCRTAAELMVSADKPVVAAAWFKVVDEGVADCTVHLAASPESPVQLHLVDVNATHGVFVGLISGVSGALAPASVDNGPVKPRLVTVRKEPTGQFLDVDPAIELLFGWTPAELLAMRSLALVHPDDNERALTAWIDVLAAPPGASRRVRLRHLHKDGTVIWIEITNHNHLDDPDQPHVVAEMLDITDEMDAHEALRANERMLSRLTETMPLGVLQIDTEGTVIYQNTRVERATGGAIGEQMKLDGIAPDDQPAVSAAIDAVLRGEDELNLEYEYRSQHHGPRRVQAIMRPLNDDEGEVTGAIICLVDITEASKLREELRHRATYDELTGCLNRSSTLAALHEALGSAGGAGTAVMFLDLNGFKAVNDGLGHAVGDQLLVLVADRLRAAVRHTDAVGRFGGDEFVVVCRDVPGPDLARRIAEAVIAALNAASLTAPGGEEICPEASVGVAWTAPGHAAAESLIARADAAMYEAKRTRTGRMALILAS